VVAHVIKNNLFKEFFIPDKYAALIKASWEEDFCSFYGRMDLAVNKDCSEIKLLEFNADTPTSLLEASVVQWFWLQDYNKHYDQFNSIHEKLIKHIGVCRPYLPGNKLWFTGITSSHEDFMTLSYIRDLANQAGLETAYTDIKQIGLNAEGRFCGLANGEYEVMENIFKLYPYEWMFHEEFGDKLDTQTTWIEPYYKALMSNKMLLVMLYKMFPDSPYLLPAYYGSANGMSSYVKKPVYGREGRNVQIVNNGNLVQETTGDYGEEGYVYQQYQPLPSFNGYKPVVGSWLIGGYTAGMGIKETPNFIHDNMSSFCPHFFK
jgi:glutathionylspermidine synthase